MSTRSRSRSPGPLRREPEPAPASGNGKTFVSPVVARIAAEHGVDPDTIAGTGRGGRVTKKDILSHIEAGPPAAAGPASPHPRRGAAGRRRAAARAGRTGRSRSPRQPARSSSR